MKRNLSLSRTLRISCVVQRPTAAVDGCDVNKVSEARGCRTVEGLNDATAHQLTAAAINVSYPTWFGSVDFMKLLESVAMERCHSGWQISSIEKFFERYGLDPFLDLNVWALFAAMNATEDKPRHSRLSSLGKRLASSRGCGRFFPPPAKW